MNFIDAGIINQIQSKTNNHEINTLITNINAFKISTHADTKKMFNDIIDKLIKQSNNPNIKEFIITQIKLLLSIIYFKLKHISDLAAKEEHAKSGVASVSGEIKSKDDENQKLKQDIEKLDTHIKEQHKMHSKRYAKIKEINARYKEGNNALNTLLEEKTIEMDQLKALIEEHKKSPKTPPHIIDELQELQQTIITIEVDLQTQTALSLELQEQLLGSMSQRQILEQKLKLAEEQLIKVNLEKSRAEEQLTKTIADSTSINNSMSALLDSNNTQTVVPYAPPTDQKKYLKYKNKYINLKNQLSK